MMRARIAAAVFMALAAAGCSKPRPAVTAPPPPALPAPAPSSPKRLERAPAASTPRPAPAPKPESAPAPVLEPLASPEQRSTWSAEIRASLQRAEQNAAMLSSRKLSAAQKQELARVRSFIRQAREAEKSRDFVTARTFADRAAILSQDLLSR